MTQDRSDLMDILLNFVQNIYIETTTDFGLYRSRRVTTTQTL